MVVGGPKMGGTAYDHSLTEGETGIVAKLIHVPCPNWCNISMMSKAIPIPMPDGSSILDIEASRSC
jgi:hypothetical protein